MSELRKTLENAVDGKVQAYFAILHAPHPETGESHYFFMKGKDGNKLRIFGGEAEAGEGPLEAILRETAEETDFIDQASGQLKDPQLYTALEEMLTKAFDNSNMQALYHDEHQLTEEEIARGWHPSDNHVFEIECDYQLLEKLHEASAMAQTPEGQGTCLLAARDVLDTGTAGFRHPYEAKAIGLQVFGQDVSEATLAIELTN